MTNDIRIYELKKIDLKGATIIDGFPSVGLVSSIVANYMINALHLEQVGIMDSPHFPTVSLIKDSDPQHPVRIYAGGKMEDERSKIVAFISEFQPPPSLVKSIAISVIEWAEEQRCSLIICPEGLVIEREADEGEEKMPDLKVYGVGSTKKARELLIEPNVLPFQEGVITGVASVLLNEGKKRDFDVIGLMAEAHPNYPDARAAAKVIEVVTRILLHVHIDIKPLYEEAERIEAQIKNVHKQTTLVKPVKHAPTPSMYG